MIALPPPRAEHRPGNQNEAEVWQARHSGRPELPIPGVSESGQDVADVVEPFVDGRQIDRNVRVMEVEILNSLRRRRSGRHT